MTHILKLIKVMPLSQVVIVAWAEFKIGLTINVKSYCQLYNK